MNSHHYAATPTLSVIDPRTLVIRSVGYCRHPDSLEIDLRITRQRFDAPGRLFESWDPRLWGTTPKANLAPVYCLSDQLLLTDSVDAGWQLSLLDHTGLPCSIWDARGSQRHTDYDAQRRPVAVAEQAIGEAPRVVERLTYGDCSSAFAAHNQCGRLVRHDDPASSQRFPELGLFGTVLREERRFLSELEIPDWPSELDARDELLEGQSFITCHLFNPTGELQCLTDAKGNVSIFSYDVAGKQSEVWLQLAGAGKSPQRLVGAIHYNAHDQVERETAGNGVVTGAVYGADDGRLIRLVAQVGNQKTLQDLNFRYDPVGNIVELEDKSQSVTHFNNQRIEPINRYRYDSLYQLVEALGWEVSTPSHGPVLPGLQPTPLDPNQRRSYIQQFEYDRAGNLVTRHHSGTPGFSMFTSNQSNRSLAQHGDGSLRDEPEIASGFDACGNQLELQRGQAMSWDIRNQLSRVTLVKRADEPDDYERYCYDRPGHRLRKVHFSQTSRRTLRTEVRYLPNLEIHRQTDGEEHHVINIEAARNRVRALHWPAGAYNDQLRYHLSDHLGSSTLELDEEAGVLTWEHYYPFGGTACWAGKSALVAKYKTFRYSGKERDATGLYYYGYRYYAPWLQRWIVPDPAGDVSGPNRYIMVGNNPVVFFDRKGLDRESAINLWRHAFKVIVDNGRNPNFDPGLFKGYYASDEGERKRSDFVADEIEHNFVVDRATIRSEYGEDDLFQNSYYKDEWVFKKVYRESGTREYFANDVVKYQYAAISKQNNFFGFLPLVINKQSVTNVKTLGVMYEAKGTPEERMQVFLRETPNGRSIQRTMDDFRLVATGFRQFPEEIVRHDMSSDRPFGTTDFYIDVRLSIRAPTGKASGVDQALRSEVRPQPSSRESHGPLVATSKNKDRCSP